MAKPEQQAEPVLVDRRNPPYKLIAKPDKESFELEINRHIGLGYMPYGNLIADHTGYYQGMLCKATVPANLR